MQKMSSPAQSTDKQPIVSKEMKDKARETGHGSRGRFLWQLSFLSESQGKASRMMAMTWEGLRGYEIIIRRWGAEGNTGWFWEVLWEVK